MRVLLQANEIQDRVRALGQELTEIYRGRPLTVIGILSGAAILVADLIRAMPISMQLGFVQASSYPGVSTTPQSLSFHLEGLPELSGRDVLLVDDILDTGATLSRISHEIRNRRAASVGTLALLWKKARTQAGIRPDYFGFEIPDEFVVGYGLDFAGEHRQLPHIAALEPRDLEIHGANN